MDMRYRGLLRSQDQDGDHHRDREHGDRGQREPPGRRQQAAMLVPGDIADTEVSGQMVGGQRLPPRSVCYAS